jgi:hypothetical protein
VGKQLRIELVAVHLEPGVLVHDAVDHPVERGHVGDSGPVVGASRQPAGEVLIERLVKKGELRVAVQNLHQAGAAAAGMGDHPPAVDRRS